jgi:hypothetical protein
VGLEYARRQNKAYRTKHRERINARWRMRYHRRKKSVV